MAGYIGSKTVNLSTTGADIAGDADVSGALDVGGAFTSQGIDDNATSTAMTLDTSNNVGIGTSSPTSYNSDIDDLVIYNAADGGITIATGTTSQGAIAFADGTSAGSEVMGRVRYDHSNNSMGFRVNNDEKMVIDSSGNLLVGKTSAADSTDGIWIDGGGRLFSTNTSDYAAQFRRNGTDGIVVYFLNDAALAGNISVSGSTTAYNTSSDYRLKTDVQSMTGATNRLQQLNPVNFEWIAEGTRVDGFLAHEVQDIVPEAIIGTHNEVDADGNPVYQGIDQAKLVPLLTAALQEALDEITDLKARVATLEAN